jgi:hypothetical protein
LDWGGSIGNLVFRKPTWGANEIVVASFTTPNQTAPDEGAHIGMVEIAEANPTYRTAVLSKTPCALSGGVGNSEGVEVNVFYSVGPNSNGWVVLEPNTTYYYNVVNRFKGAESCVVGVNGNAPTCGAILEMSRPKSLNALPAGTPNYSNTACSSGGGNGTPAAPFAGNCPGFSSTITYKFDWQSSAGNISIFTAGFGPDTALVASLTTPVGSSNDIGNIDITERQDPQAYRMIKLSTAPCGQGTVLGVSEGISGPIYFSIGNPVSGYPTLAPNTTYYYFVTNNYSNGVNSCNTPTCNARIQLIKPKGL